MFDKGGILNVHVDLDSKENPHSLLVGQDTPHPWRPGMTDNILGAGHGRSHLWGQARQTTLMGPGMADHTHGAGHGRPHSWGWAWQTTLMGPGMADHTHVALLECGLLCFYATFA